MEPVTIMRLDGVMNITTKNPTLVLGGTGKTGARVAEHLTTRVIALPAGDVAEPSIDVDDIAALDGRNACVTHDVDDVLGRPARDFADDARTTAARGMWTHELRQDLR